MDKSQNIKSEIFTSKLLILFVFLSSCKALTSIEKYQGLWLGELKNNGITDHQMIKIKDDKIYFFDLDDIVDSVHTIKKNRIINNSQTIFGKIKFLDEEAKTLRVVSNAKKNDNADYLKKVIPTQLMCSVKIINKLNKKDVEWHIVITEEGRYYCTERINDIEDLSKYEFSKIKILKIDKTYFMAIQDRKGKNILAPILKIQDDEFEVYSDFDEEKLKIIWGKPE